MADVPAAPVARGEYSIENARDFAWSSVSGTLNAERVRLLDRSLVGPKVLDAGCGGGGYVDYLARRGLDATGVDKFDAFLALAREKEFRGTFLQADLTTRLPFPDHTFDSTFCFDVLEHVDDEVAIRELARVTRRRLIVAVPSEDQRRDRYSLTYIPYIDQTHLRYYTPDRLQRLADLIRPAKVEVFPEGRVPLEILVRKEFRVQSKYRLLNGLYRRLFDFLKHRATGPDWYINLVAVIDLSEPGSGGPP